jgi:hypothetical protein
MTVAKVLNEREIAAELGLKPATVRRLRVQLGLPHFRTAGRIFYRLDSVLAFLDKQEQNSQTEPELETGTLRRVK